MIWQDSVTPARLISKRFVPFITDQSLAYIKVFVKILFNILEKFGYGIAERDVTGGKLIFQARG
jgi:hypothetical protein